MRHTPISLILSAAALLGCSFASAQQLTIDGINTTLQNLSGQASVTIDPASGNVIVKSASGSACAAVAQPTASVTAQSTAVSQQAVTVSWTSTNTTGNVCVPSSNPVNASWNSPSPAGTSGSRQVTMPLVTTGSVNQALTMTCTGGVGTTPAVSTRNITVDAIIPTGCDGTPTDGLNVSANTWANVINPNVNPFPGPNGSNLPLDIGQNTVIAIAFTSGNGTVNPNGTIETFERSLADGGPVRISISKCPGDFRPSLREGKRCATTGDGGIQQLLTFLTGHPGTGSTCGITANSAYFLNVTFKRVAIPANEPGGPVTASDCSSSQCGLYFTTRTLTRAAELELGIEPSQPE